MAEITIVLRKLRAFTLTELMIVVVIVGLLAAMAYPSYINQVRKGRRADAQAALYDLAQAMERFYTRSHDYSTATLGSDGVFPDLWPKDKKNKFFKLSINTVTTQTYYKLSAKAIANTVQAEDTCPDLWLDSIGNTGAEKQGVSVESCW